MNKQLLQQAKRIVDERRFASEDKAERLLANLRENAEFAAIERDLRKAQVNLAMGIGNSKELTGEIAQLQKQQSALLRKLGLSDNVITPQYHCHKCNDRGFVNGEMCSCLQEEMRKLIVADSNVINTDYTFANSRETNRHNLAVYKKAREVCLDGKTNILLTGSTGSGKTYLITACANLCMEQGRSVLLVTAYSLNNSLLEAHLSGYEMRQAMLDSLVDVDVLVVDDLGTETPYKNVTAEYLFAVINERIARGKQTFISTNLTLTEIRERYDERMFSRLVDANLTFVAQLEGDDKRLNRN